MQTIDFTVMRNLTRLVINVCVCLQVDCWSLGVLLYTLVYGAMPFDGSDFQKLKKQITAGKYYEPADQVEASSLIRSMLTVNPAKRANITDVADHWWTNKDIDPLREELSKITGRRTSDYFEDDNIFSEIQEKSAPERIVTPVFDSTRKPKKSILKKRNISSGDSGCGLFDNKDAEMSVSSVESTSDDTGPPRVRAESELVGGLEQETKTKQRSISLLTATVRRTSVRKDSLSSSSSTELLDFTYDSNNESALEAFPEAILELL